MQVAVTLLTLTNHLIPNTYYFSNDLFAILIIFCLIKKIKRDALYSAATVPKPSAKSLYV